MSGLCIEFRLPSRQVGFVISGPVGDPPPVEFDDTRCEGLEKPPVVGYKKYGSPEFEEEFLKPADRFDVEKIGRASCRERV